MRTYPEYGLNPMVRERFLRHLMESAIRHNMTYYCGITLATRTT